MEISQVSFRETSVDNKTKLTNDLMRLLQVREKNEDMAKDWLLFLIGSRFNRLRPGEIYEAFRMAMARELLDEKGNEINLLPELSNNTTGKVLTAYVKWKIQNDNYQLAKNKLKALSAKTEPTEEEKMQIREEFLRSIFEDIKEKKASMDAWLIYADLEPKIMIPVSVKKRLYRLQENRYLVELKIDVDNQGKRPHHVQLYNEMLQKKQTGKLNTIVQNRCRSIAVSHYLRKFTDDFETFKKAIEQ